MTLKEQMDCKNKGYIPEQKIDKDGQRENCPNTELFVVRIFLYLDTFHAVTEWMIE